MEFKLHLFKRSLLFVTYNLLMFTAFYLFKTLSGFNLMNYVFIASLLLIANIPIIKLDNDNIFRLIMYLICSFLFILILGIFGWVVDFFMAFVKGAGLFLISLNLTFLLGYLFMKFVLRHEYFN